MASSTDFMNSEVQINLTDSSNYHNRVLVVGDKRFYVGADILATWSEHFRGMFSGNFAEATKTEIEIEDVDPDSFEAFLYVIYLNNDLHITANLILPLIDLSFRFLAPNVLRICETYVRENLSQFTKLLPDLLRTACEYNIIRLKKMVSFRFFESAWLVNHDNVEKLAQCAEQYNLTDLQTWTSGYMNNRYTEVHSEKLVDDFSKLGLTGITDEEISKTVNWKVDQIKKNHIIPLVHVALAHESEILQEKLHTRIHSFNYGLDPLTGITRNTFIELNMDEINSCLTEVQTFIKISSSVSPLLEFVEDDENDQ